MPNHANCYVLSIYISTYHSTAQSSIDISVSKAVHARFHGWGKSADDAYGGNDKRMWLFLNVDPENDTIATLEAPISSSDGIPYFMAFPHSTIKSQSDSQPSVSTKPECTCQSCPKCHFSDLVRDHTMYNNMY